MCEINKEYLDLFQKYLDDESRELIVEKVPLEFKRVAKEYNKLHQELFSE